jgi:hypothetical protein
MDRKIIHIYEPTFDDELACIKQNKGEYKAGNLACVWSKPTVNLREKYHYNGKRRLGYKIFFYAPFTEKLEDFVWKPRHGENLITSTNIQNLFWLEGMAPRVLDIVLFESSKRKYYAQVTELMEDEEMVPWTEEALLKANRFMKENYILRNYLDRGPFHCFGNYFVDFSDYYFRSVEDYRQKLKKKLVEKVPDGQTKTVYQSVPELGVVGARDLSKRLEVLDFDNIDFTNKTVLVYGCNAGATCREVAKRGASKVVGLDFPEITKVAYELAFHLGYNNIDFYGDNFDHRNTGENVYEKIQQLTGIKQFDVVTFLACMQMEFPSYLNKICKDVFFFEGHKGETREKYEPLLKKIFKKVNYLGKVTDCGVRPAFKCLIKQ